MQNTLLEYAKQLGTKPSLLHELVATAKQSDSPVIRYGAVALDKNGNVVSHGYSKMADGENELRWADDKGRLHAEMGALCDAQQRGYDVSKLDVYILPLAPDRNSEKVPRVQQENEPAGYLMLRDTDTQGNPHFTCTDCGPKLAQLDVNVHILTQEGWKGLSGIQAAEDSAELAQLQENTGCKPRRNEVPYSLNAGNNDAPALQADGYRLLRRNYRI